MTPAVSWPGTTGTTMFSSHFSSSKMPTSLWHRPAALTSMTTLPDSMVGSGMSTLSNGLWVPLNCQAFISNSYIEFDDCSSADIAGHSSSFAASLSKGQGLSVESPQSRRPGPPPKTQNCRQPPGSTPDPDGTSCGSGARKRYPDLHGRGAP